MIICRYTVDKQHNKSSSYKWKEQHTFHTFRPKLVYVLLCRCSLVMFYCTHINQDYYLPKFTIFGKYVRLSVCLSVCLSVSLSVLSSITHERFDISSPNLVHIRNGWAVPVCDIDKWVGHGIRSPGQKIGQIFKSPQLRQFLSYKFDQ